MTVGELELILGTVEDKSKEVCTDFVYNSEINGYYMDKRKDLDVLVLTNLKVQPRV